jgi:hypothetical protein
MSRKNKVNPDHYKVAGRLAPDDLARERMKQGLAKTVRDWDERTNKSAASTGHGAEAAVLSSTARPAASRSAESSAKAHGKSAERTDKKPVSTRSAATKPARTAATGMKKLGRKKTIRRTRANR